MMDIVKPGTEVRFKKQFAANMHGIVKAVWIGGTGGPDTVQYQIQYCHNGQFHEPYVLREMFEVVEGPEKPAGFTFKQIP